MFAKVLTMSFYYHKSWIVFYLFFTNLNLSIRIHNQKTDCAFKVQYCRRRVEKHKINLHNKLNNMHCLKDFMILKDP